MLNDAKPLIMGTRSILAWQQHAKTQTRRLARPLPEKDDWKLWQDSDGRWWWYERQGRAGFRLMPVRQPYDLGDLLWIREGLERSVLPRACYAADNDFVHKGGIWAFWHWKRYKLPAMFMPRWACRYYGEVVSVRRERLRQISHMDALAEGVWAGQKPTYHHASGDYLEWWDSMHRKPGTRSQDNPWVWVYGLEAADASTE